MDDLLERLRREDADEREITPALQPLEPDVDGADELATESAPVNQLMGAGAVGFFGLGAAASVAADTLRGVARAYRASRAARDHARLDASVPIGETVLATCGLTSQQFATLSKIESVLGPEDGYSELTLGLLAQVERLLAGALLDHGRPPEALVDPVSAHLDVKRRTFLAEKMGEPHPFALGAVSVWVQGLGRAWAAKDTAVTAALRQILTQPEACFVDARLVKNIESWRPLRNDLAHGRATAAQQAFRTTCEVVLARTSIGEFLSCPMIPNASAIVDLMSNVRARVPRP